ncbi:MAG: ABC transporter substrate-binding protein [Desulfobacteraceae bacterium]|nr:ABC transporter substrate-binding protein [Desulfobacteraceae bacterium]
MNQHKHFNLKLVAALFVAAGLLLLSNSAFAKTFVIKDSKGNLLTIEKSPARIVSVVPSATEILFKIGAKDRVAGLTYHDAGLEGSHGKIVVGGFFLPSFERIKRIEPDLIILSSYHKDLIEKFKNIGTKIFIYDTDSIAQSFDTILTLGKIVDRQATALKVVEKNKAQLAHIKQKLGKAIKGQPKRVMRLMGRKTLMTPGSDSFQNNLIRAAGGIPPDFGKKGSVVTVTKEEWQSFNPQVLYGCGPDRKLADTVFSKDGWKTVDAVKNKQLFYFPCELTCRAATHTGYFVSWLSSVIYSDEFADPKNDIMPKRITAVRPVDIDLPFVKSAAVKTSWIYDFENKTLVIDFNRDQTIVSTLEGQRTGIKTVGNHYSPPPCWMPGHKRGITDINTTIVKAMGKKKEEASFLITGADMDNLCVETVQYKDMKVTALVTAGVLSNAVRMSKDTGLFYEPGTINIILLTNMHLTPRAMTRAIISATEGKTAALEDMDIRSTYSPLVHEATGTGTDNVLVVQGQGTKIKNTGGHTKMGELIANAVYKGVRQAIYKQNKLVGKRHIFQRLKERKLSIYGLTSNVECECMNQKQGGKNNFSALVEDLLLQDKYAAFLESALSISDEYEKGLIKDLTFFKSWCKSIAAEIARQPVTEIENLVQQQDLPIVFKTALNAIFTGALERLRHE